jgi:hypothetical protein
MVADDTTPAGARRSSHADESIESHGATASLDDLAALASLAK